METIVKMRGFTLIELLLVIVIMVMAVSVISFNIGSGNQTAILNGAAREISSGLRFARGHALTYGKESFFLVNLENNTYQVTDRNNLYKLSTELEITLDVAQSQIAGEKQGGIRFFQDGSSTGGRITLELAEQKRQLDVNWLTGKVDLSEF